MMLIENKKQDMSYFLKHNSHKKIKGFTLIEVMVSVAIFTIIITTGIGSLVSIINTYEVTQQQKKVHDGLNSALESITRELRLGRSYVSVRTGAPSTDGETHIITFQGVDGGDADDELDTIVYFLDTEDQTLKISRNSGLPQSLTNNNEIIVTDALFRVIGSTPFSVGADNNQPLVWIRIKARAVGSDQETVVQTLVSQRSLDF